ncbi:MAG: hypothetical protein K6G90_09185 [Clostridia bacterium]|nr:hypothetical protein [Clostridia bacterium]
MKYTIDHDLHIHTKLSSCSQDPRQTTEKILGYALNNGLKTICVTDHYWDETIPVGFIGWHAFRGYIIYKLNDSFSYSKIKSISCGRNLRKIEGKTIPGVITIKATAGTYARKYALKNKCKYEDRE